MNKYNLKGTFNLNSSLLGLSGQLDRNDKVVRHNKINPYDVKRIYAEHEVAAHTLTHPNLTTLDNDTIKWQVEQDRKTLGSLVGYKIKCMAYTGGGVNNDDRVAEIIKRETKIKCARTATSTYSFDIQENLYRFNPSIYYIEVNKLFEMGKEFINLKTEEPKLFYIWGHSYEMDAGYIQWEDFEKFCKLISNKDDIFYGTNSEIFFGR